MSTPPRFLLGASLATWGWLADKPLAAALLVVVVEGVPLLRHRWQFDDREFERVTDLTSIGFALFAVWTWVASRDLAQGILDLLSWLPALLAPLVLMQRLSGTGRFPLSALFWSLRRHRQTPARAVAIDYAYFCHVLIATAATAPRTLHLGVACGVLGAYALWPWRRPGTRALQWIAAAVAAAGVAGALGFGMTVAQRYVEARVLDYFRDRAALASRADRARTAIGDLGALEQSGRIVLRVEAPPASRPHRLRDGVFDTYQSGVWYAPVSPVRSIPPVGTDSWVLDPRSVPHRARISLWLTGGRGSLPVPEGTVRLDALNAGAVQAAAHGTVLVAQAAEYLDFTARFDGTSLADGPPTPRDLSVPSRLAPVLQRVAEEAGVATLPPAMALARLRAFFHDGFGYTVRLGAEGGAPRPLDVFLTTDRRGHCEYFATAAALVLRQLGIPARYVTGYAVEEWSEREGAFVVRARDGHAWTEVWIDGRWQSLDATPPAWRALETAESSARPIRDTLSWLFHRFTRWRFDTRDEGDGPDALWLLLIVPLAGWVLWGVMRRSRRARAEAPAVRSAPHPEPWPETVALEQALAKLGFTRRPSQSVRGWMRGLPGDRLPELAVLIAWSERHDRARYDPAERAGAPDTVAALRAEALALARGLDARTGPGV